jgi:hypothetical protein
MRAGIRNAVLSLGGSANLDDAVFRELSDLASRRPPLAPLILTALQSSGPGPNVSAYVGRFVNPGTRIEGAFVQGLVLMARSDLRLALLTVDDMFRSNEWNDLHRLWSIQAMAGVGRVDPIYKVGIEAFIATAHEWVLRVGEFTVEGPGGVPEGRGPSHRRVDPGPAYWACLRNVIAANGSGQRGADALASIAMRVLRGGVPDGMNMTRAMAQSLELCPERMVTALIGAVSARDLDDGQRAVVLEAIRIAKIPEEARTRLEGVEEALISGMSEARRAEFEAPRTGR